jgi:hypothetical protein
VSESQDPGYLGLYKVANVARLNSLQRSGFACVNCGDDPPRQVPAGFHPDGGQLFRCADGCGGDVLDLVGDIATIEKTFTVVHDPDDDTRFDVEQVTYQVHKPLSARAVWTAVPGQPWQLLAVTVYGTLRSQKNGPEFPISWSGGDTPASKPRGNMAFMPAWLAAAVALHAPAGAR